MHSTFRHSQISGKQAAASPEPSIDLTSLFVLLREKWLWIMGGVALALGLAFFYLAVTPKEYRARAVVQVAVELEKKETNNFEQVMAEDFKAAEAIKTVEGALSSRSLLLSVIQELQLKERLFALDVKPGEAPLSETEMVHNMEDRVEVRLRRGSRLIDVLVTDTDPVRGRDIAQAMVDQYIQRTVAQKVEQVGASKEVLEQQAEEIRDKLEASENALQRYREQYQTNSLEDKQNMTGEKLKELNKNLQAARGQRVKLESELPFLQKSSTLPVEELATLQSVAQDREIQDAQKMYAEANGTYAAIQQRYGPLHPRYQEAAGTVRELADHLERVVRKAANQAANLYQSAVEAERKLEEALREEEKLGVELSRVAIPYNVLLRETQASRTLYEALLARIKETHVAQSIGRSNIRFAEEPLIPVDPIKPRKSLVLAFALMAGTALPTLAILFFGALNTSIRSVDRAEELLGIPSLVAIPESRRRRAKQSSGDLVCVSDPASLTTEAFRGLRTGLALQPDGPPQTVLFTSAVPAEGKSFCSANCAVALAQQKHRVLLIDADLRRPGLVKTFPALSSQVGLSDVLAGEVDFEGACHPTGIEGLDLLPAGNCRGRPSELFSGSAFEDVLVRARGKYDRVVIDTAPVCAVSDTLLVARLVDAVCFVIRARTTPERTLLRALETLRRAGAEPAGFVLNRLPVKLADYYYYSTGHYSTAGVYGA